MSLVELISLLRRLKVKLYVDGDNLRLNAPPNTITPEIRQELARHKAELIDFLQHATLPVSSFQSPLKIKSRPGQLPLSFAQERLWFMYQFEPGSPMYNIPLAFRLRGQVDVAALERSLSLVIERHETLRTVFEYRDGYAYQVILPPEPFHLQQVDLPGDWRDWVQTEANRPFDLMHGPILRAALLRLGLDDSLLFLNIHHIAADGWSISVLLQEVSGLYSTLADGRPDSLPPLPVQYVDFAIWQRDWLQGETLNKQLDYWRNLLQDVPTAIDLPLDHFRPGVQGYRGETCEFPISPDLFESLREFSNQQGVTLFMSLLAAFQVLLFRYSNQAEFTLGTPIANRTRVEIEGLIGFFVNTLVLRADLSGDPTFLELLQLVRETSLAAYAHQDVPFEKLVDELKVERDLSRNALFQVMFALQNTPASALTLPGVEVEELWVATDTSKFDLSFTINENSRGTFIEIQYSTDLFEAETIRRLAGHYQCLLAGILANPAQKISLLPLLTDSELHRILFEWNNTRVDFPKRQCIHELFEEQVERTPENIAVIFADQRLTYLELNQQADRLAGHLQTLGVGQDVLVGVCLDRSIEMLVSLLAVLKAGGAYVPLDPGYPPERVAYMLQNSQATVLLSQYRIKDKLPAFNGHIVYVDIGWEQPSDKSQPVPERRTIRPLVSDLAYVIYTSGSTGQAKGAMLTHGSISNHMNWMQADFPLSEEDAVLQKTPFSFDASVWEFYAPLLAGGRLVMAEPGGHMYPAYLVQAINEHKITVLQLVPTLLDLLCQEPGFASCHSLKRVFCGGEALESRLVTKFSSILPGVELVNLYGPTEATIDSVVWRCPVEKLSAESTYSIPIGRPIANMQAYILDAALRPVPVGVTGELHLGGPGVGRGYLYRPELTAEKFIPNPFGEGVIYKTGDLCRYLLDGNIEFLGRMDHQVKIRGFRIELGEIEAALTGQPGVKRVVVVARTIASGEKRLVAYLVIDDIAHKDEVILALRDSLKQKLPDYMIPGAFVALEKFPFTPNGKIDRKALPDPDNTALVSSAKFVAPQTSTESILAGIWADLLGLLRVGKYDNFFELGGDSILSLQFVNRAQAQGLYLTPRHVFEAQTIEALAQIAQSSLPVEQEQEPESNELPLAPVQHRFFEQHSGYQQFNQSVLVDVDRPVTLGLISQAVEYLLSYHDALRLRFEATAHGWRQWLADEQSLEQLVSEVDLSAFDPIEQQARLGAINQELQASLNIHDGPLLRVALFYFGDNQPRKLLFVLHHLAVDYISWQILIADLWSVCDQLAQNRPIHLQGKGTSFKAWTRWLTEYAHREKLQAEMPYWLELDRQPIQPLPLDFPGQIDRNQVADSATVVVNLSTTETQALLRDVPNIYHTQINDILLTALAQAFASWTGRSSLLVDLEGHGREADNLDLSRTVGWFTSIFPVCLRLEGQDIGTMIKSIKEQLRRIPNKGMGYGVLRYLNPETAAQLAGLPEAQVCFNYAGQLKTVTVQALGGEWSQEENLGYLLTIDAALVNGQLSASWRYSREIYRPETLENLAHAFIQTLKEIIVHCQSPQAGGYTPSDFPLSALSQAELDRLVGQSASDIVDLYPLSPLQAMILSHNLASPDSGIYCIQTAFQLTGNLDVPRFKQSCQQVVKRHTILRTSFSWQGLPEPLQIVHRRAVLPWDELDWQDVPPVEQNLRLQQLLRRERENGFNLDRASLTKYTLIRIDTNRYWFVWHCHHLLMDGWSVPVLVREALDLYLDPTKTMPPARPYRDYIAWQAGQDRMQAQQFWRDQLAGFSIPTPLPGQKIREHFPDGNYLQETLVLTTSVTTALQVIAQRNRLTLNTLCQGAWALVLSHYSGMEDVVFGVTVSGRSASLPEIESRVGLFINTLPLRVKIIPGLPWESWLQMLMQTQTVLEHYAYTPLEILAACSDVPASQPLFQSNLRFQNYPLRSIGSLSENRFRVEVFQNVDFWHYLLNLAIVPESALQLSMTYDARYFDAPGIRQVLLKLEDVLSRFVNVAPGDSLDSLLPG